MSIIHDYIGTFGKDEHKCGKLINKCARINELELYLNNLDARARLEQTSSANLNHPAIQMIDKQNERLRQEIVNKITLAIQNSNIGNKELFCYATRANSTLGNDVDMINMHQDQSTQAFKIYMVTNIILEHLNNIQQQSFAR